ncbi:MAG: hypothetical protein QOF67_431, partial [Mycobacterium sp.]|nr:hypothetical protein [Mycobacterium sp.]
PDMSHADELVARAAIQATTTAISRPSAPTRAQEGASRTTW